MDRRNFLRTGGVALAVGLAGCSGLLDDGGGGESAATEGSDTRSRSTADPQSTTATSRSATTGTTTGPRFEVDLSSSGPAPVGDPLEVRVAVVNAGDREGSFVDTLRVDGPPTRTHSVSIDDVPPGGRDSTTVAVSRESAGSYEASLVDRPASVRVRVAPVTDFGSSVALGGDLRFGATSVSVEPAVLVEGPGWGYLQDPVPGILGGTMDDHNDWFAAVVCGRVENVGSDPVEFDPDAVELLADGRIDLPLYDDPTPTGVEPGTARIPNAGRTLANATVPPGESVEGVLLAPINRYLAGKTVAAVVRRDETGPPEGVWRSAPGGGQRSLPAFEVRDLSVPDEVEVGAEREFSATVANVGSADGRFRGLLHDHVYGEKHTPLGTLAGEIPAGGTRRLSGTMVCPWTRKREVVLHPSGTTETIQARKAKRAYGETYTMPNGVTVKVFSPVYSDFIEYGDDENWSHGMWTVAVEAELPDRARGKGLGKELLPAATDFRCYRHEERIPYRDPLRVEFVSAKKNAQNNRNSIISPVQGDIYPLDFPDAPSDGSIGGWLTFTIGPEKYHFETERIEIQLLDDVFREHDHFQASWSEKYR